MDAKLRQRSVAGFARAVLLLAPVLVIAGCSLLHKTLPDLRRTTAIEVTVHAGVSLTKSELESITRKSDGQPNYQLVTKSQQGMPSSVTLQGTVDNLGRIADIIEILDRHAKGWEPYLVTEPNYPTWITLHGTKTPVDFWTFVPPCKAEGSVFHVSAPGISATKTLPWQDCRELMVALGLVE